MKRFGLIALSLVLLTGCSQSSAFESLANGPCSASQSKEVSAHLSSQIDALAAKDWELAYSYSSKAFHRAFTVDEFARVIQEQYIILVENTGYSFNQCNVSAGAIAQEVQIDSQGESFILNYKLVIDDLKLGVDAAVVSSLVTNLDL